MSFCGEPGSEPQEEVEPVDEEFEIYAQRLSRYKHDARASDGVASERVTSIGVTQFCNGYAMRVNASRPQHAFGRKKLIDLRHMTLMMQQASHISAEISLRTFLGGRNADLYVHDEATPEATE